MSCANTRSPTLAGVCCMLTYCPVSMLGICTLIFKKRDKDTK